jgi:hypothetical protein
MDYRCLVLLSILCTSCEEKDFKVTITGRVSDAVTGLPVDGAIVSLRIYYCEEGRCYSKTVSDAPSLTGSDGTYTLNYKYNIDHPVVFKERPFPFPEAHNVYSTKTGYITSDNHSLYDNIFDNADIKMYHSAQLNLHVKNEKINNLDGVRVCIDRGLGFSVFGTPQFILVCRGFDFDSVYVLKELWGGFSYTCKVIPLTGSTYNPVPFVNKSISLLPDTINELSISF